MSKIIAFCKKELVLCIAAIAAMVTCFFVKPSIQYLSYIDWNTLALLFSLMTVVAGFRRCGVFSILGDVLCTRVRSVRSLCGVLVFLCFFLSMFVTNDVSLITFVPFAIAVLLSLGVDGTYIMYTVVLQTVAANVGSMLTPIGNPQNLFLYGKMHISLFAFMRILLPYTVISFFLLLLALLLVPERAVDATLLSKSKSRGMQKSASGAKSIGVRMALYGVLFVVSILSVLGVFPKWVAALATFVLVAAVDRKTFCDVDYLLLLTFVAFFVFTGNIQHLDAVKNLLEQVVQKNECVVSIIASQVMSNVPSALLLYPFSKNVAGLLCGVDIGGLGTLVASLASLISFKIYGASRDPKLPSTMKFLVVFTIVNILFLAVLLGAYFILT